MSYGRVCLFSAAFPHTSFRQSNNYTWQTSVYLNALADGDLLIMVKREDSGKPYCDYPLFKNVSGQPDPIEHDEVPAALGGQDMGDGRQRHLRRVSFEPFTAFDAKSNCSAACTRPGSVVPTRSVPARSRIC